MIRKGSGWRLGQKGKMAGRQKKLPRPGWFCRTGGRREIGYTASVAFSEDGISSLKIEGEESGGKIRAAAYDSGLFVIDQTPPDLEISGVSHRSANQGEVRPAIRYTDENIEMESLEISLTGYRNGEEAAGAGRSTCLRTARELCLDDLAHTREQDDMYTLKASVQDLAGNRSEEQISFSVNRFGSVYTFDEKTERLAGAAGSIFYEAGAGACNHGDECGHAGISGDCLQS